MRPEPDVADLVRFAVEAERAGIDGVMVSEHVVLGPSASEDGLPVNPRDYALPGNQDPASPWPSPLVLLSGTAAATSRLRLVAGALISPLRHPLTTAKDLATLERLAGDPRGVPRSVRKISFERIWIEPQPVRRGGPPLWFGGSSLHPRLIARLVRYGSGFNPLGAVADEDLDYAGPTCPGAAPELRG